MNDLTVLLPVRDGADHIARALDSLVDQTLSGFTVLVLDDGSEDETPDIVEAFSRQDPRIQWVAGPREGLVTTLQRGLSMVETPFVARMDADDVSYPTRLQRQRSFLGANQALGGCGAGVRYTAERGVTDHAGAYQSWLNGMTTWAAVERDLFVECPLAHPTFFFRTEVLHAVGGYQDRGWPEDYDLLLRLWRAGYRFTAVSEVLLDWSIQPGGLSRSHPAYSLDAFRRCRAHHLALSHFSEGQEAFVWGSGPTGKAFARACQAAGIQVAGFADVDPRKVGQSIYGIPVRSSEAVAEFKEAIHLGAVARKEGREQVREMALGLGLVEGKNFLSVA